jgi:hypothetical protein
LSSAFNTGWQPGAGSPEFLGPETATGVFPEFNLGYYHHRWDAFAGLSYRRPRGTTTAYGAGRELTRRALSLDLAKYLGDYHGFVPFLGVSLGPERLSATTWDGTERRTAAANDWNYGLLFGWDIRPNRLQNFCLRTTLRYYPNLAQPAATSVTGSRHRFDQLEINFIQFLFYLNR